MDVKKMNPGTMFTSLDECKNWLRSHYNNGDAAECPCCNQMVKLYKRSVTSTMAYVLILMYKRNDDEFFDVADYLCKLKDLPSPVKRCSDFTKLKNWGLIEPHGLQREDGSNRNGVYRITKHGEQFVEGSMNIIKYMHMYNGSVVGSSGDQVNIKDCLSNKFDYSKLMSNI